MLRMISRRNLTIAGAAALGLGIGGCPVRLTSAATTKLTAVQWGGPWLDAVKAIAGKQEKVDVRWELLSGGAASILPKIKATWPNPSYDIIDTWDPVYISMINEGWLEPITLKEVPNLESIPEKLLFKDKSSNIINVPMSVGGNLWGYRNDTMPFKFENMDQFLDPRLKSKICWPNPVVSTNTQLVSLALHRGGNEKNLEPGWEFLKEIAKSGNIGRIGSSDVDILNSLTTGETSIAFSGPGIWNSAAKEHPVTLLNRMETSPGLKTFSYQEGWVILKNSPNKVAAKEFLNLLISPENNEFYNEQLGQAPTNIKSKTNEAAKAISFKVDELEKFVYTPDYNLLSQTLDAAVARFEKEIMPLL